jgi:two-component system, OmpR family, sensor histidine kinase BaeS
MSPRGWDGRRWRGPGWRGSGPPPWWPEGESWPPAGRPPWARMRRGFMWRIAGFMAAAFLLMAVVLTIGIVLVGTAAGLIAAPPAVRVLALGLLLLFLVLLARGGRRFRRLALNVGEIIDAAHRIEAGDYGVQVAEHGPRDVRTLARAFNAMSARLAATDRTRRAFVADLTHEFRTPLAIIRGQAEGIGDGVYPGDAAHTAPIVEATRSLESLVDALGTMTLADVGSLQLHRESVEVAVLVNSSLAAFQSLADGARVRLASEVAPNTPSISADPVRLRSVLMNLLSNAVRHTPAGGTVTVSAQPSGDLVTIRVRDTGEGIP